MRTHLMILTAALSLVATASALAGNAPGGGGAASAPAAPSGGGGGFSSGGGGGGHSFSGGGGHSFSAGQGSGGAGAMGGHAGSTAGGRASAGYTVLSSGHAQYGTAPTGSRIFSTSNRTGVIVGARAHSAATAVRIADRRAPVADHKADRRVWRTKLDLHPRNVCGVGGGPGACASFQPQQEPCDPLNGDVFAPIALDSCLNAGRGPRAGLVR
jgi:hypothetical protein